MLKRIYNENTEIHNGLNDNQTIVAVIKFFNSKFFYWNHKWGLHYGCLERQNPQ
jgi:hypothetical protein